MTGSTITALSANLSIIRHLLPIVRLFVPHRFAIIFYSKILISEPSPIPPCPLMTRLPGFSSFRLLSSVVEPIP
jgi:hypothetical protein